MAEPLQFYDWARGAAASKADKIENGRLQGELLLKAENMIDPPHTSKPIKFEFLGPHDVRRLLPGAIRRRYPSPGAAGVDPDYCAYVEFSAPDLPWRYSLLKEPSGALKPWLALVVGTPAEISLLPGERAQLRGGVKAAHDLSRSARWAHVQQDEHGHKHEVARLLSPRDLSQEKTTWLALLVPAFDEHGGPHWGTDPAPVTIPVYTWWTFQTFEKLGFVKLAGRLEPERPPHSLGYAPLAYPTQADPAAELRPQMMIAGAVIKAITIGEPDPRREELPAEVDNHLQGLLVGGDLPRDDAGRPIDENGRPVVKLPLYGEPWINPGDPQPLWAAELNGDPRLRGAAGLGAWAAIEWQEKIVDAAAKQAGSLPIAAQRLRGLTFGLELSRRLWDRRLAPAPLEERVLILGLAMARMDTEQGSTLLEHVTAGGRPLPPALFSSAARRLLRPRGPLGRRAAEGAMRPARWLPALNDCEQFAAPQPPSDGMTHADFLDIPDLERPLADFLAGHGDDAAGAAENFNIEPHILDAMQEIWDEESAALEEAGAEPGEFSIDALPGQLRAGRTVLRLLEEATVSEPDRTCRAQKVNLTILDERLLEAMNPHAESPFVVRRVLGTISGLDDQPLTPPELCLDFEIPAWQFLRDFDKNWILPGIDRLAVVQRDAAGVALLDEEGRPLIVPDKDPVVAASTNDLFTDAFMTGFNQQALRELRWRNIPVQTGCTPLRRFWEPVGVRPAAPPHPKAGQLDTLEDINGIHLWGDTPLGDDSHETAGVRGDNLILVFKTPLFRRYPDTLVYLVPRLAGDEAWAGEPDWGAARLEPNLQALIDKETTLFGFSREPDVLKDHWLVVEQIPRGFNFYNHADVVPDATRKLTYPGAAGGGEFAAAAFVNPLRVIIEGRLMRIEEN